MPGAPPSRRWLFLGVLVDVLTEPGAPVTVAEVVAPEGASPPAHVHAALDDSGPARVLLVHADDSFLAAVQQIGRPAAGTDISDATPGPTIEELDRALAAHGITNVGPPIEQAEAERLLGQRAAAAVRNRRQLTRGLDRWHATHGQPR